MKNILRLTAYIVLPFTALYFTVWAFLTLQHVWYVHIVETNLGEPMYQNKRMVKGAPNQLTVSQRAALHKFPDLNSCIRADTNSPNTEELMQMDWSEIQNSAQVEICAFRI